MTGGVDCDVHLPVPSMESLSPYLPAVWQEISVSRGIRSFAETPLPEQAPMRCRPDWRGDDGGVRQEPDFLVKTVLDDRAVDAAICHALHPVQKLFDPHMAAVFARAVNDYVAEEWLRHDARLHASVLISPYDPEKAAQEIKSRAADKRFVQVIMQATAELPYGKPFYDPIWRAACDADMPVAIHIGNSGRFAQTATGWASYQLEDQIDQSLAFQGQLASMVSHGVFQRFPDLMVVLLESGVAWLPAFAWRFGKFWRGSRVEVPWLDEPPMDVFERHVKMTIQPFDGPDDEESIRALLDHLGSSGMLLYASDFPHWHFDGINAFPKGFDETMQRRTACDNPRQLYSRMQ